jgi:Zn-dependent protease
MSISPPFIISILIALTVHEVSHGLVALKLGDPTAKHEGRLTLNPLAHLDLFGTLMFFFVGFGWAKPVPVNPRYFKGSIKKGMTLTALAGPASNLILAIITIIIAKIIFASGISAGPGISKFFMELFQSMLFLNLGLMAFNLLPVAPLDGSKVLAMFVPYQHEEKYEDYLRNGPMILLSLLIMERILGIPLIIGWISAIISPILLVIDKIL